MFLSISNNLHIFHNLICYIRNGYISLNALNEISRNVFISKRLETFQYIITLKMKYSLSTKKKKKKQQNFALLLFILKKYTKKIYTKKYTKKIYAISK